MCALTSAKDVENCLCLTRVMVLFISVRNAARKERIKDDTYTDTMDCGPARRNEADYTLS
jgi:hypothetical protein